jgi:hypothetical protein
MMVLLHDLDDNGIIINMDNVVCIGVDDDGGDTQVNFEGNDYTFVKETVPEICGILNRSSVML